jgi:hypothetical protein
MQCFKIVSILWMNVETKVQTFNLLLSFFITIKLKLGSVDECVAAADIYQCGKEKAPSATSAIQAGLTDSSPINVRKICMAKYVFKNYSKRFGVR